MEKPSCRALDVNGDGKIDSKDAQAALTAAFDVNGDGKVDSKDARAAFTLGLLSWSLMALPAVAKGGGSGHSHSSSSSSHSSSSHSSSSYRYSSSSSNDTPSYPEFRRPLPNYHYSRPEDPNACSDLPAEGELLSVLVDPYHGTYTSGTVVRVNENNCKFTISYPGMYDGRPNFKTGYCNKNWVDWLEASVVASYLLFASGIPFRVMDETARLFESTTESVFAATTITAFELEKKVRNFSTVHQAYQPVDGLYVGSTSESDGVSQSVQLELQFSEDGKITGSGKDTIDGTYSITGTWNGNELEWKEQYRSFTVAVTGYFCSDSDISCLLTSSKHVVGRFKIKKTDWLGSM